MGSKRPMTQNFSRSSCFGRPPLPPLPAKPGSANCRAFWDSGVNGLSINIRPSLGRMVDPPPLGQIFCHSPTQFLSSSIVFHSYSCLLVSSKMEVVFACSSCLKWIQWEENKIEGKPSHPWIHWVLLKYTLMHGKDGTCSVRWFFTTIKNKNET